jgi:hypothetical protein
MMANGNHLSSPGVSEEDVRAGRFASERKVQEMFGRFDQA